MNLNHIRSLPVQHGPFSIPLDVGEGRVQEVDIAMYFDSAKQKLFHVLSQSGLNGSADDLPIVSFRSSGLPHSLRLAVKDGDGAIAQARADMAKGMHLLVYEWLQGGNPAAAQEEFQQLMYGTAKKPFITEGGGALLGPIDLRHTLADGSEREFQVSMISYEQAQRVYSILQLPPASSEDPLLRVASACSYGHAIGSVLCDCRVQLQQALEQIAQAGGSLIYGWHEEGRGVGHVDHFRAYELHQTQGLDSVAAYQQLGLTVDAREYGDLGDICHTLDMSTVRLLTNNPKKVDAVRRAGVSVTNRVPLRVQVTDYNKRQIDVRRQKLGHDY